MIRPEFQAHALNAKGKQKILILEETFSSLLECVEAGGVTGRQLALVKTDLQTACFNAKKGIAELPENQE